MLGQADASQARVSAAVSGETSPNRLKLLECVGVSLPVIQEAADDLATTQNLWADKQPVCFNGLFNSTEAENARDKLNKLLAKHRLSWNDLPAILSATERADRHNTGNTATQPATETTTSAVNVLDLVVRLVEIHIAVDAEEAFGNRALDFAYLCV